MADYTIRVVLHDNATWQDYDNLRRNLAIKGVVDYIKSDDGRWWRLPPAEYTHASNDDLSTVTNKVSATAGAIKRCSVLVSQASSRQWVGLEQLNGPG